MDEVKITIECAPKSALPISGITDGRGFRITAYGKQLFFANFPTEVDPAWLFDAAVEARDAQAPAT